jgi:acetate kinase
LDTLVHSIRHWIGAFLLDLGGLDALVFTAGIGENNPDLRAEVCQNLEAFGIHLDPAPNNTCKAREALISTADSPVKIFVIPANEELVLAREVFRKLS